MKEPTDDTPRRSAAAVEHAAERSSPAGTRKRKRQMADARRRSSACVWLGALTFLAVFAD